MASISELLGEDHYRDVIKPVQDAHVRTWRLAEIARLFAGAPSQGGWDLDNMACDGATYTWGELAE